jgi:hypothetical protein
MNVEDIRSTNFFKNLIDNSHWELGNNGNGDLSCIGSDGDNNFFTFNNKQQVFLT